MGAADATSGDASGAPAARAVQALRSYWQRGSGAAVAGVFHKLLALVFLDAWISLGVQVHVLVGSRGLLPLAAFLQAARVEGSPTFGDFPTLFWLGASDGTLTAGVLLGGALALAALAGARPRLCLGLSTTLYLSFTVACRTFFSFQWDNLLLECGLLVLFLPADRRAPWAHWLFRVLLFKLYFESGIAKWQSHLGDWQDGSAMTFYYETAPLPTWLGWYLHALPAWWHHFESWATLVMELAVPFAFFGPRPARLAAAAVLTGFQTVNLASANYGFFVHLALALHVFLLDDRDVARAAALVRAWAAATRARLARRWPALSGGAPSPSDGAPPPGGAPSRAGVAPTSGGAPSRAGVAPINGGAPSRAGVAALPHGAPSGARAPAVTPRSAAADTELRRLRAVGAALFAAAYLFVSALEAWRAFGPRPTDIDVASGEPFEWLQEIYEPWRLVNTYHLFGHITTERIEPAFETFDGRDWTEHALRHKPADTARAPDFVAPHQPRVDFQL
ncbi:MAG TPA: lipase maturation factor family protein, partial [Myxococcota bacterium]|nr:lipase maturation factor family protein [Myxococcota bacterium]